MIRKDRFTPKIREMGRGGGEREHYKGPVKEKFSVFRTQKLADLLVDTRKGNAGRLERCAAMLLFGPIGHVNIIGHVYFKTRSHYVGQAVLKQREGLPPSPEY